MKSQSQKINKLYYNRWPYKIECWVEKAGKFIQRDKLTKLRKTNWVRAGFMNADSNKFFNKIDPFLEDNELQFRIEGNHVNIFCLDTQLRDQLCVALEPWVKDWHGPDTAEELTFITSSENRKVVCNLLPYDRYQFRLYFKSNMPTDLKLRFLSWSENYQDRVLLSKTTKLWMSEWRYRWAQGPFMYIEDSKTLTMIGLFLGEHVKKIEEFIPRSSINTILDQEQTCQP